MPRQEFVIFKNLEGKWHYTKINSQAAPQKHPLYALESSKHPLYLVGQSL
jgi:hypothetical protein